MILLALSAAALAAQPEEETRFPYQPLVSASSVVATASGEVTCSLSVNGVMAPDQGCDYTAGAPDGLRALHRQARLTMVLSILPEGGPPRAAEAAPGELIVEARARLEIAPDGSISGCQTRAQRVIRRAAGVEAAPDFCANYPIGRPAFVAAEGAGPRAVEMSALVYLE